jgi:uncharacterized protein (TIGR02118 family)
MIRLAVLYPNKPGAKFDFDYYVATHIPLFKQRMEPFGLVRAEIDKGIPGPLPDSPPPFVAVFLCVFQSLDGFQKGFASHAQEIVADIPNFTNVQPQVQLSKMLQ